MKLHLYIPAGISGRARSLLRRVGVSAEAAGVKVHIQHDGVVRVSGDALLTYGAGGLQQRAAISLYRACSRPTVTFDLGYWGREKQTTDRCWRWAINGNHPSAELVARAQDCHLEQTLAALPSASVADPAGRILFCLAGRKTHIAYPGVIAEERDLLAQALAEFGARLLVRAKANSTSEPTLPIEQALVGCAGVVSHSSNVSIDAARRGVPFFCAGGVAAPFCGPSLARMAECRPVPMLLRAGYFNAAERDIDSGLAWSRIRSLL